MENNLYKKLRFFALCLAIICMVLSLIKRAKAEELPEELQEQIIDLLDNDLNISVNQTYLDNCFSCPYCAVYNINNGSHNIYYFDFYFTKNIGYLYERYGGRYYYATSMYFEYPGSNRGYITCSSEYDGSIGTGYRIIVDDNSYYYGSVTATSSNIVASDNFNVNGLPSDYSDIYGYNVYSNSTSSYSYNVLISYGNCYLQHGSNFTIHQDTYTPPPTNNTDGFNVFKTTRSGRDYLIFDGLNAVPINIRNGNWYLTDLISTLGFTVTTETGSYDYSYSFDIDDASDEFPYNSNYFKWQDDWGNLFLRWEIPIDELNLPDDSYGYTENIIMTVSNNISINNVSVPYLGQFIYLTPVYLYGTQAESGLINPGDAAPPIIPENPVTQEDKAKNYQSLVYGTLLNKSTTEYNAWINGLHDGILYNQIVFTQLNAPTLSDLLSQFPDMVSILKDVISYAYGIQGKNDFLDAMETYIEENAFSQYVDYLVFVYNGNDAEHNDKFDFYIFETAKGRQKAISFLLDTSNTYFDKQFDVLRNSIPYIKDSIDRIDTNLFNLGEDIFSQNNSIIANLISIDNKFNDLQNLLKDLFNKLFDKLNDLHLTQLDSIDNKLSSIVSAIQTETPFNEDDTIAESIAYYQSHTQTQAVLEDKYSVWFTGYCHFWLQEYGEEEPVRNNRSSNVNDFASSEKRHILFRTFKVITNIYDKMQEDLLFNRVEELFDYFLNVSSDVSHTRRSYFYDVFNEQNTPTLDYNPYE